MLANDCGIFASKTENVQINPGSIDKRDEQFYEERDTEMYKKHQE
jgi:hypothetical protein